jgi:hypothetical protein
MRNNSGYSMAGSGEKRKRKATQYNLSTGPSAMGFSGETEKEMVL